MIQDAEGKIRSKDNEELDLFIEELIGLRCEGRLDEMDAALLEIAEDEKAKRQH